MNNESAAFEESQLKALQEILHNRIMQKKEEVHDSHSEAYTGSLSREIETLHWVLAQILTLKRIYNSSSRSSNKNSNISREEVNQRRRGSRTTTVTIKKEQV
jgi:hypothetical protein